MIALVFKFCWDFILDQKLKFGVNAFCDAIFVYMFLLLDRQCVAEEDDQLHHAANASKLSADMGSAVETDVGQWNVLQFNTGSTTPFIIKCGANSSSELVVKADSRVQEPKGSEIVRVVPRPTVLENMSLEEMKELFAQLPESLSLLALARTADGTRARYSRLYRTLAMKVPALRDLVNELEKGGVLKDVKS